MSGSGTARQERRAPAAVRPEPGVFQPPLTPEAFQARLAVSRETLDKFRAYAALLSKWNRAINLVSPKSLDDLWRRHFLDSAQLQPYLPVPPAPGCQ